MDCSDSNKGKRRTKGSLHEQLNLKLIKVVNNSSGDDDSLNDREEQNTANEDKIVEKS